MPSMNPQRVSKPENQAPRYELRFLQSAAAILLFTAIAKGASAFGKQSILDKVDPVFWVLKNRELLLLVSILEILPCICRRAAPR